MESTTSTHGIKFKDKLGYALGDTGGLLTFGLISSYLSMFYTDVLKIKTYKVSVLMLVARIWDAINDPLWGAFIDTRKPTRWGRFRPYILFASFPLAIGGFLMFCKIPGLSQTQYLIFAYITYIFYGMMYTGVNIPYGSLASVVTDDEIERSSLSMWRSVGAGIGGLPAQIFLPLFVMTAVTDTDGAIVQKLDPSKFTPAVGVLAVATVVIYFIHFKLTKERVALPPTQKQSDFSVKRTIRSLLRNKPFIVLCVISMLLICFQMYTQTIYNFLFKDFYVQPKLYSLITVCTYLPMALFLPIMGKLVRRFGKKEICSAGLAFAAAVNIILYAASFSELCRNPYVFLVLAFFSGAGQTFLVLEVWALVMDVIDYQEFLSGRREEGTSYSFYSFARKLGQTLAGFGATAILGAIGYDGDLVSQPEIVIDKMYTIATLVPAVMLIAMFILMRFFYSLSKPRLEELHDKLRQKNELSAQAE